MGVKLTDMGTREKVTDALISFMLTCLMAFSLTFGIINTLKLIENPVYILIMILICCMVFMIAFYNKKSFITIVILISIALFAAVIYLNQKDQLQIFLKRAKKEILMFSYWFMEFMYGNPISVSVYKRILVIGICVIIAFVVYILTVKRFSFLPLFIVGMSYFVYQIINSMNINTLAFYGFIFSSLLYYFKYSYLNLKKRVEDDNQAKQGLFMMVGVILSSFILVAGILLSYIAPVELKLLHDLSYKISKKNYTEFYYDVEFFSLGQVGIGDGDTRLGGNIDPDDTIILEVASPKGTYLKAISKNVYQNNSWSETDFPEILWLDAENAEMPVSKFNPMLDDIDELNFGMTHFSDKRLLDVATLDHVKVTFKNIKTKSLFTPLKLEKLGYHGMSRELILKTNDTLKMDRTAGKNFTYEMEYYLVDYNNKDLEEALRNSKVGLYNEWNSNNPVELEQAQRLGERAKLIREHYCILPEDLPQRVKELAYGITSEQTNDYDKAKAIENYLANNYLYTYTPGTPQKGKDFVDYFLFDNKQGYCTYFATSMAILTRCIGLPSRYIEGYTTPASYKPGTTVYEVTNKQAHAWVEVYFEGFGWIPFEPTAVYRNAFRQDYGPSPVNTGMPNFTGTYSMFDENLVVGTGRVSINNAYSFLDILPLVIVAFTLLLIIAIRYWKKWRLTKISARDAILKCYKAYLNIFAYQKVPIHENETPRTFAARIDETFTFKQATFKEITEIFLMARYSQLDMDEEQRKKVLDFRKDIMENLKKHVGRPKYIFYRIRKG